MRALLTEALHKYMNLNVVARMRLRTKNLIDRQLLEIKLSETLLIAQLH